MDSNKSYDELNTEFIEVEEEMNRLYAQIEELQNRRAELREALHAKRPVRYRR